MISGRGYGRTFLMYLEAIDKALGAIDSGAEDYVVLMVRPKGNLRITFKKDPDPRPEHVPLADDSVVVDFPNG